LPKELDCHITGTGLTEPLRQSVTDSNSSSTAPNESWDNYWRNAGHDAAYAQEGISHPLIHYFWNEFFETVRAHYDSPRIIDIASGNGAVVTCADAVFNGQLADFTCLDESAAAIDALCRRFRAATTLVADARLQPFAVRKAHKRFGLPITREILTRFAQEVPVGWWGKRRGVAAVSELRYPQ
jgi:hypothetical protein